MKIGASLNSRYLPIALVGIVVLFLASILYVNRQVVNDGSSGKVLGVCTSENNCSNSGYVYSNDFEHHNNGVYTRSQWNTDWDSPGASPGLDNGWLSIVNDSTQGKVLRMFYNKDQRLPKGGGIDFKHDLGRGYDELYFSYKIKFDNTFAWYPNGKLNGLCGGDCNSGGDDANGYNGWSVRLHWHDISCSSGTANCACYSGFGCYLTNQGVASTYVYHADTPGSYGQADGWDGFRYSKDRWYQVVVRVKMNDVGQRNGIAEAWVDGVKVQSKSDYEFRKTNSLDIDKLFMSTFFGGSTPSQTDTYIYFDEITVTKSYPSTSTTSSVTTTSSSATSSAQPEDITIGKVVLVSTPDGSVVRELGVDNAINFEDTVPGLSILAEDVSPQVSSVDFYFNDTFIRTEANVPLAIGGDGSGEIFSFDQLTLGNHTVRVEPKDVQGNLGIPFEASISITNDAQVSSCPGDYTDDGYVNAADLSIFAQNYLVTGASCDIDLAGNDCTLNEADLLVFIDKYKQPGCSF